MTARGNPLVSFVVPTLNRKRYVNRTVRSCLAQQTEGIDVEVVVIDSHSDDGSWEELTAEFEADARVKLIQNDRGRGPTASWIDGAMHATGDAVTFAWSDDYLLPGFVESLMPPILAGASFAFGEGIVRDIDDESAPPVRRRPAVTMDAGRATRSFLGGFDQDLGLLPVSPTCALFASSAFCEWTQNVERLAKVNPFTAHFLWERAIGPDLLLFLVAAAGNGSAGSAVALRTPVCQFSAHSGSISIASSRWRLQLGYWLTRALWFRQFASQSILDEAGRAEVTAQLLNYGMLLTILTPRGGTEGMSRWEVVRSLLVALVAVLRDSRSKPIAVLIQVVRHVVTTPLNLIRVLRDRRLA